MPRRSLDTAVPERASRRREAVVLALAIAWVLVLGGAQATVSGRLVVVPWLALGPLAASLVLTWRRTAVVAVLSVLAVALLSLRVGDPFLWAGAIRILGSAALAGFAVFGASVRAQREQRIRAVTEIATVAQTAIQHPVPTLVAGLALASRYVSASADALVGGDLYDVVATEQGVRVIVGDVRGKGLPAVHTAAAVLSAFRHTAPLPAARLDDVARAVEQAVLARLGPEDFVTAVFCDVHPDGRLDVVLCGHPSPLRLTAGCAPVAVGEHRSPPLGLGLDVRVETATLGEGERLLLFTDGLVEARSSDGEFFDLTSQLSLLAPREPVTPQSLETDLDRLLGAVRGHVGGVVGDDLALLLLQHVPAPGAGRR
ncbi:PP2C family protein-serine/threonine phosphatase [Kineococcus rubinsiae]|uniref:PP2C family protein-serine/threonine phosphatase n=1 Tax=Kineococcus rubinsiae TaxID=2609562 RepID=UPI001FCC5573|nr:PP2C family protein-serine/threonine phosphatase [Kineococcus rubinsiae]